MSLLLDALKKAAEKKAKSGADAKSKDPAEITARLDDSLPAEAADETVSKDIPLKVSELETTALNRTAIEKTERDSQTELPRELTAHQATELDVTDLVEDSTEHDDAVQFGDGEYTQEMTAIEATELESASLDRTQLDKTETVSQTDLTRELTAHQATELDVTDLVEDSTEHDDAVQFGDGEYTQEMTAIEAKELEPASLDRTQLDKTETVSQTELPRELTAHQATELDVTDLVEDSTEHDDAVQFGDAEYTQEMTAIEATELEADSLDRTQLDKTETVSQAELPRELTAHQATELDVTDLVEDSTEHDDAVQFGDGEYTQEMTAIEATELIPAALDQTAIDKTELDKTEQQEAQIESSREIGSLEATELDVTDLVEDSTEHDDAVQFGDAERTREMTSIEETELIPAALDQTAIDKTELDKTEQQETQVESSREIGSLEATELDVTDLVEDSTEHDDAVQFGDAERTREMTSIEETELIPAALDQTAIDKTELDKTEQQETQVESSREIGSLEATELDVTDLVEDSTEHDDAVQFGDEEYTREMTSIEVTELIPAALDETAIDKTELDKTEQQDSQIELTRDMTSIEVTELIPAAQDETAIDKTELDKTEQQETQIESSRDIASLEATELDVTDLVEDSTQQNDAVETGDEEYTQQMSFIQAGETEPSTLDPTALDATQNISGETADSTEVEPTALDRTATDDTENDALQLGGITQPVPSTEAGEAKTSEKENSAGESTSLDTMEMEAITSGATQHDDAQFEVIRNFFQDMDNQTRQIGMGDDNVKLYSEDRTSATNTSTYGESTMEIPGLRKNPDEEEYLTNEDVTEFMGDGVSDAAQKTDDRSGTSQNKLSPEDTTRESSESLGFTNYGADDSTEEHQDFEDFSLVLQDQAWSDSSQEDNDAEGTAEISIPEVPDRDASTFVNSSATSTTTSPSFDIDKLTNDETVTVEGKTTTRTYAPDNYDRTLLNMSDKDVSRIFPGMKSESDAVMTPDYAKKVFLSRSGRQKTHYFRIYAAVGLLLFLAVILSGLYELQGEAESIDRGMVGLKRDPMPGILKPKIRATETQLFASEVVEADIKALDVIDSAERSGPPSAQQEAIVSALIDKTALDNAIVMQQKAEPAQVQASVVAQKALPDEDLTKGKEILAPKTDSRPAPPGSASRGASSLQIAVKNEVDTRHQLLSAAYNAYTQGDLAAARISYEKVLQQDNTNRDALLGRAAIHIQDNEYEQAIEKYQRLLVINPKDSMAITSLITVANIEPYAGEEQLKNMIYEQPESAYLYFALGNIFGSQNRWIEAQNAYFEALQYSPEEPNYAYNLAVSLEHIDKPGQAIKYYQKALDNRSRGQATFNSELVSSRMEVLAR